MGAGSVCPECQHSQHDGRVCFEWVQGQIAIDVDISGQGVHISSACGCLASLRAPVPPETPRGPAEQWPSRSVQRRIAEQKGLPMPRFAPGSDEPLPPETPHKGGPPGCRSCGGPVAADGLCVDGFSCNGLRAREEAEEEAAAGLAVPEGVPRLSDECGCGHTRINHSFVDETECKINGCTCMVFMRVRSTPPPAETPPEPRCGTCKHGVHLNACTVPYKKDGTMSGWTCGCPQRGHDAAGTFAGPPAETVRGGCSECALLLHQRAGILKLLDAEKARAEKAERERDKFAAETESLRTSQRLTGEAFESSQADVAKMRDERDSALSALAEVRGLLREARDRIKRMLAAEHHQYWNAVEHESEHFLNRPDVIKALSPTTGTAAATEETP